MNLKKTGKDMKCSFLYSHYEEILREALKQGYVLTSFRDYDPEARRAIVLRHDIDEATNVRQMARIEHKCGATATYFLRVHSRHYNPFSYENYKAFRQLIGMGHELGLHIDGIPFIGLASENLVSEVNKEKTLLETMFDVSIESASLHGLWTLPAPDYFGLKAQDLGIRNYAYAPKFTKDMKYISDSSARWKEGCLCKLLGKYDKIQVLTHPDWWYEREEVAYDRW
jgi:hypothetical protein